MPESTVSARARLGGSAKRRRTAAAALLFGSIFVGLIALLMRFELDPVESRRQRHSFSVEGLEWDRYLVDDLLGVVVGLTTVGLLVFLALRGSAIARRRWVTHVGHCGLLALVVVGSFLYLYGHRGIVYPQYTRLHDTFHYHTGPKYFDELGYFDLYDCVAQADWEGHRRLDEETKIRDLQGYGFLPSADARARTDCSERFTPERWEAFRADMDFYAGRTRRGFWRGVLKDHGYNGTPFHTYLVGGLANHIPAAHASLTWAAMIDVGALLLMMVLVVRSFGWTTGLLFAVFFFTNFADRFWFIGGGFCRYLWMAALGSGLAMLKEERHLSAGILIAASAMLNAFPVLFLIGIAAKAAWAGRRTRRLAGSHRRFFAGVALVTVLLGGLSVSHGKGLGNYDDFLSNMAQHTDLITVSRIGFRYDFLYRGEVRSQGRKYSVRKKKKELRRMAPLIFGLATVVVGVAVATATRLDDTEATILCGYSAFFFLFGTVEYYFACGAVVILLWARWWHSRAGPWLAWLAFLPMLLAYVAWHETRYIGFCNNTVLSVTLTLYLLATLGFFAHQTGLARDIVARVRSAARRPVRGGPRL